MTLHLNTVKVKKNAKNWGGICHIIKLCKAVMLSYISIKKTVTTESDKLMTDWVSECMADRLIEELIFWKVL